MKRVAKNLLRYLFANSIAQSVAHYLIRILSKLADINLLNFTYKEIGILKYQSLEASGEIYSIRKILKRYCDQARPIFFDVGANRGNYAVALRAEFPAAEIFAFEPNPNTFALLSANVRSTGDHCCCLGLSDTERSQPIYTYDDALDSEHASLSKSIMSDIHHAKSIRSIEIKLTTLDNFCNANNVDRINFLKIDAEGCELDILRGGQRMLKEGRIDIIQYEFNETLIVPRVFMKDFYEILGGYNFYRLDTKRLIPLRDYSPIHEIFQFQNILAISKKMDREHS